MASIYAESNDVTLNTVTIILNEECYGLLKPIVDARQCRFEKVANEVIKAYFEMIESLKQPPGRYPGMD